MDSTRDNHRMRTSHVLTTAAIHGTSLPPNFLHPSPTLSTVWPVFGHTSSQICCPPSSSTPWAFLSPPPLLPTRQRVLKARSLLPSPLKRQHPSPHSHHLQSRQILPEIPRVSKSSKAWMEERVSCWADGQPCCISSIPSPSQLVSAGLPLLWKICSSSPPSAAPWQVTAAHLNPSKVISCPVRQGCTKGVVTPLL